MTLDIPAFTVVSDRQNVAAAGTRVQLPAATTRSVSVKAWPTNTALIYVGGAAVAAAHGYPLSKGDAVDLDVHDLSDVWIDADVNGEAVGYLYVSGP